MKNTAVKKKKPIKDKIKTTEPKSSPPIIVTLPNTTELKMKAILAIAEATKNISHALISTNVNISISDVVMNNVADCGIKVGFPPSA